MELALAIPLGLLLSGSLESYKRPLYAFAAVVMAMSLVATNSRGGIISLGAEIFFVVLVASFGWFKKKNQTRGQRVRGALVRAGLAFGLVVILITGAVVISGPEVFTRFLGTPLVLFALVHAEHVDEAFLMLLRLEPPSWLYQVEMGATTVWERWDALAPDGTIHSGEMATDDSSGMLSFNHYAYGAVVDWVYRYVGGLAPTLERPGYRRIVVAPRPSTAIPWARASVETRLGAASVDWRLVDADLELDLVVPFGAEAVLDLPVTEGSTVEVDGVPHGGAPLGPGSHRVVATAVRVADPAALVTPAL